MIEVEVKYEDQVTQLPLLVVEGSGPSLLGRDWLLKIKLDWKSLNFYHIENARMPPKLNNLLAKHTQIFEDELRLIKSIKAKIHLDASCQPRFCKPRSIPYALCDRVETELERLTKAGVMKAIEFSDWAAPIVPVMKRDGSVQICGDYKLTFNQTAKLDPYPLPRFVCPLSWRKDIHKIGLSPCLPKNRVRRIFHGLCNYQHTQGSLQV